VQDGCTRIEEREDPGVIVERLKGILPARREHAVVLYSKPGCHLCEDAHELLTRVATRRRFTLSEIDIRGDPELFRRYDIRIPVLVIDGEIELDAPLRERDVLRALR
jgi:glutaredoxin